MSDLKDKIEELATQPQRVSTDAGTVESRSLKELIEADKYLQEKETATNPTKQFRFAKLIPPGTC